MLAIAPSENKTRMSLVIPCYNEAACIDMFMENIGQVSDLETVDLEFVFINDGSTDDTLQILQARLEDDPRIVIVDLSRNFGKEAALSAGLKVAIGDVIVPIDADLQDPPELIPYMLEQWRQGFEVVLARRIDRKSDSWFKRSSACLFYKLHNRFADPKLPENVGDFRLMDRCVVDALNSLPESCRFMKGLFAWVGFRTTQIDYVRPPRVAEKSKFNFWKLWNFALDGITGFSTIPLRIWTYLGLVFAITAFMYAGMIFFRTLIHGVDVPGYASLLVSIIFFGGIQLIGIGILGEYLGRNYIESKRRPVYLVRKIYKK